MGGYSKKENSSSVSVILVLTQLGGLEKGTQAAPSINSFDLLFISRYAIYIPLFLPISLPVLLSLRQAIRWYRGKDNTGEKDEQKDKQD